MSKDSVEKIMTLNLNGKKGVNIDKSKYTIMKNSILSVLKESDQTKLSDLGQLVEMDLDGNFDGKIGWYMMAVKLDLEARGIIRKVPKSSPQKLEIV